MNTSSPSDLRGLLLAVINDQQPGDQLSAPLQSTSILREAAQRSNIQGHLDLEQALLTQFYELFRTGYLAWGMNLNNPDPPFFHTTEQGVHALENYSRDPGNPAGYFQHIASIGALDSIAMSYLQEAISCYNANLVKSAAVMVGGAAERLIIELRDKTEAQLNDLSQPVPSRMTDWRSRTIAKALQDFFESKKKEFSKRLREDFEAYWAPFTHHIRTGRNDAGHPASIEPVTPDAIHASLLIFPEFAKLQNQLLIWVAQDLS